MANNKQPSLSDPRIAREINNMVDDLFAKGIRVTRAPKKPAPKKTSK